MKHVKSFNQLFESNFTSDAIKDLSGYKKIMDQGWVDITTPIMAKNGTLKFEHPEDDQYTTIHSNGYIRGQSKHSDRAHQRISPLHSDKPANAIFGRPVKNIEDYNIKFKWLENYWIKKYLKRSGATGSVIKNALENPENVEELSRFINDLIEKDPTAISPAGLENLERSGLLNPTDYTKTIKDLRDIGLF
jgi:hypothetical protein